MTWRVLPPAGNRITLDEGAGDLPRFKGFRSLWLDSGTAALALALIAARSRHPEVLSPEVVLPGYGCPDLIAAAVHAGVKPVLADICPDDPSYDLDRLRAAISSNTIAVIAVNFLGICERLDELRRALAAYPSITLIEDNAQWFPEPSDAPTLVGDCIVLSFGRGKPVSLLGGGALLVRTEFAESARALVSALASDRSDASFRFKALLYNVLRRPLLYGTVTRIPGLSLGKTEYHELRSIDAMDRQRKQALSANVEQYLARGREIERQLARLVPSAMNLPLHAGARSGRLLRYPVLAKDRSARDRIYAALTARGLGASIMYGCALADIPSVRRFVGQAHTPNAANFAERLLTLPTHQDVTPAALRAIGEVLAS